MCSNELLIYLFFISVVEPWAACRIQLDVKSYMLINPLSGNLTKWSNTFKQFVDEFR